MRKKKEFVSRTVTYEGEKFTLSVDNAATKKMFAQWSKTIEWAEADIVL